MTDETDFWNLIATGREAVLSTINRSGLPQLSNVLYLPGNSGHTVRISTTADRLKARNLARDPRAVLHVSGDIAPGGRRPRPATGAAPQR